LVFHFKGCKKYRLLLNKKEYKMKNYLAKKKMIWKFIVPTFAIILVMT